MSEGVKSTAKKVAKSRVSQKTKERFASVAKNVGKNVPVVGMMIPALEIVKGAKLAPKVVAGQKADKAMREVKKNLAKSGQKLTREQERTLQKQHYEYFLKHG